jgi:hypothetical protein
MNTHQYSIWPKATFRISSYCGNAEIQPDAFNVTCVIRLLSAKLLAAEVQRPAFTLHRALTSAPSTDRGKGEK